jgi:hypothetical protein
VQVTCNTPLTYIAISDCPPKKKDKKMCISENYINGIKVECRECWQCNAAHVNDFVGRAIAEMKTPKYGYFITLTYRDSDDLQEQARAVLLHYQDVQKFFKAIRSKKIGKKKLKYKQANISYFVCGQYGELTHRAHWHVLLFSDQQIDELEPYGMEKIKGMTHTPFWRWGHVDVEKMSVESIYYVMRYMTRNPEENEFSSEEEYHMSTKPPLGLNYFLAHAKTLVEQNAPFTNCMYHFPDVLKKDTFTPRQFRLRGVVREKFIEAYVKGFVQKKGIDYTGDWRDHLDDIPYSSFLEGYFDNNSKPEMKTDTPYQYKRKQIPLKAKQFEPAQVFVINNWVDITGNGVVEYVTNIIVQQLNRIKPVIFAEVQAQDGELITVELFNVPECLLGIAPHYQDKWQNCHEYFVFLPKFKDIF